LIVVDASVVVNVVADDGEDGDLARDRIARDPDLHAPHVLDLEVTSALRKRTASGVLEAGRAADALEGLRLLVVARYPHIPLLARAWELRANVTPYDAAYLALAEALGCRLVTTDVALANVPGARCPVDVLL
jgi:predicted nucleic acid-binding protein